MSANSRAQFLRIIAIIFFVYSILWGLAPFLSVNLPARFILDISHWPLDRLDLPLDQNTMWLSAIGSGLLAAISVFLWGVVAPAIKTGDQSVIRTSIAAMVIWYGIDSIGSVAAGVESNVIFNTVYLALVLFPLVVRDQGIVNKKDGR